MTASKVLLFIFASVAAGLVAGCRDRGPPSEPLGLELGPGDGLLEHLAEAHVAQNPQTSVPTRLRELVRALLVERAVTIPAEAWEPVAEEWPEEERGKGPGTTWQVSPELRPDLELGRVVLHHEGRQPRPDVEAWRRPTRIPGDRAWVDGPGATRFSWSTADGLLHARREGRPGEVRVAYEWVAGSALDLLEARLTEREPFPGDARPLRCRAALGTVDRPCLLAPAPTTLAWDIAALEADSLRVTVGVLDVGFRLHEGRLLRARGRSDGVTFAVDVETGGVVTRAWERHVDELDAFLDDEVDLARWAGRPVVLRLVTEPGPAAEANFDYGLWSGLRLAGEPRKSPDRPHVVLIDVDTLRADRLGCYGYGRATSPRLDAWAASRGELFSDATSTSNWTLPATVSMLTGLAVAQYPVLRFPQALTEEAEPLAMRLASVGYQTYARTEGGFVGASFGFALGFELFDSRQRGWKVHQKIGWDEELERLRNRRSERPVFYFLHTYQVHEPYRDDRRFEDPENPYAGPLDAEVRSRKGLVAKDRIDGRPPTEADRRFVEDLYDAGVRRMDDVVGAFLEELPEVFGEDAYLVILTSDHGEELLDHGHFGHGKTLYREQLHVPLIVEHPGHGRIGRTDLPVSILDIVPTILDYAGLPVPDHLPGQTLRELPAAPRLRVAQHADSAHAIDFDGYKAIVGEITAFGATRPVRSLFRPNDDPGERDDRAGSEPTVVRRLMRLLEHYEEQFPRLEGVGPAEIAVDAAQVEGLQALGYLGDEGEDG